MENTASCEYIQISVLWPRGSSADIEPGMAKGFVLNWVILTDSILLLLALLTEGGENEEDKNG